ncbi:hypothetical protein HK104_003395, partial [Borealophlyctis nickersoniae]
MSGLPPLYPPFRFGHVEEDLHRGAYPKPRNFRFLKRLSLRAIVSLTPEPPSAALLEFCTAHNITPIHIRVDKPKEDTIPLSFPKTASIIAALMDPVNLPCYVHCIDGSVVTGAAIMCLRKVQGWALASAKVECTRYLKEGALGSELIEFVEKFNADIDVPSALPKWMWGGHVSFRKHAYPAVRLKLPPAQQGAGGGAG